MPKKIQNTDNYMILTKVDEQGEEKGKWYLNASTSVIAAMQILDEGKYNQRTQIFLKGTQGILTVKEHPKDIIEKEKLDC